MPGVPVNKAAPPNGEASLLLSPLDILNGISEIKIQDGGEKY